MVGAALSIVLFTVFTLPTWFLISLGTDSTDAWADLGYVALMILILLVLPPIALAVSFAVGMPVDKRTMAGPKTRAAAWFAQIAAAPALIATAIAMLSGSVAPWLPFVNLVLPAAAAGFVARMVVDRVMGNRTATMVVLAVTAVVAAAPLFMLALTRFGGV
jgi:hypothetical protein